MPHPRLLSLCSCLCMALLMILVPTSALAQSSGGQSRARRTSDAFDVPQASLFLPVAGYRSGGMDAVSVAVADLNGDGKLDIVLANYCLAFDTNGNCDGYNSFGKIGVLLGNGDGTFQRAVTYTSGGYDTSSVVIADMNGDGKPDIVVSNLCDSVATCTNNTGEGTVSLLLGNGDGTFQTASSFSSEGYRSNAVAVADVNGDGKLDIIVANQCNVYTNCGAKGEGWVAILLGNGDGTFQAAKGYNAGPPNVVSVAIADVNGDGNLDLVVANGSVGVMLGNGDGTFQKAVDYSPGGTGSLSVAVADVNGDSKPDILVVTSYCVEGTAGCVNVLLGNGDGTFQKAVSYGSGGELYVYSVTVADVNGDGNPDLVLAITGAGSNGAVSVLLGNGDGTFFPAQTYMGSGEIAAYAVAVADVNGDGLPDLIEANLCNPIGCYAGQVGVLLHGPGNPSPTITSLVSSINPVVTGQPVTYTATVAAQNKGTVTGTIAFNDSSTTEATVPVVNNVATYSTTYMATGNQVMTAAYSGDTNFSGSTSPILYEDVIGPVTTTTTVTTSGSPSTLNQPVTFTATVTTTYQSIPNGETVTFYDASTQLGTGTTSSGAATFTTSTLALGTHTIRAVYAGDAIQKTSSGSVSQVVQVYTTTTTLTSSVDPSAYGQKVTLTATVATAGTITPTGTVTFTNGTTTIGTETLSSGVATLSTTTLPVGKLSITATYNGDKLNGKSTSAPLTQTVNPATLTMTLTSTPNPSITSEPVKFSVALTSNGAVPTGTVTFTLGATTLGTAPLSAGKATFSTPTLPAGSDAVTAAYAANTDFTAASASVTQVVNGTTTVLTSTPNPSNYGQAVTFTAKVTPTGSTIPTGSVTFTNNTTATNLGSATLNSTTGVSTLTVSKLAVGTASITATYNGDTKDGKSTSAPITQTVKPATITMTLASKPNPSTAGQSVTFTATLTSNGSLPTGSVTFSYNSTTLGTGTIASGKASFATTTLPTGSDVVTATFAATTDYSAASASVTQTVN